VAADEASLEGGDDEGGLAAIGLADDDVEDAADAVRTQLGTSLRLAPSSARSRES